MHHLAVLHFGFFFLTLNVASAATQVVLSDDVIGASPSSSSSNIQQGVKRNGAYFQVHHKPINVLLGESVHLECPQSNPIWLFRRHKQPTDMPIGTSSASDVAEDLIVTRHGVIIANYKHKIKCHFKHKHRVILLTDATFNDEGLYTCLYLQAIDSLASHSPSSLTRRNDSNSHFIAPQNDRQLQIRYTFNVTVFTLINGFSMNIRPAVVSPSAPPLVLNLSGSSSSTKSANDDSSSPSSSSANDNKSENGGDLVESVFVRENEELLVDCVVESSRPEADVHFSFKSEASGKIDNATTTSLSPRVIKQVTQNQDQTFKTVLNVNFRTQHTDHGKVLSCEAQNSILNQRIQRKKLLNVLFAPVCKDPPNYAYFVGINQSIYIECRIAGANPNRINFYWELSESMQFIAIKNNNFSSDDVRSSVLPGGGFANTDALRRYRMHIGGDEHDSFYRDKWSNLLESRLSSRIFWKPSDMDDFGQLKCKASNEIGSTECIYQVKLGGIPNPPSDCSFILKNSSAIISCRVGFHQGDPDIYCFLLKKSDNGVYNEHTRNRESCSFIVNDVNMNKPNEFLIYSSNKYGHNKEHGVSLTIGEEDKSEALASNSSQITHLTVAVICSLVFLSFVCMVCYKVKKTSQDDNDDSINDSDRYTKRASAADYLHKDLLSDTNLMEKAAENNHHVNNNHVTFKSSMYYPADVESCTKYNPKIDYFDKTDKQGNYQNKISQM